MLDTLILGVNELLSLLNEKGIKVGLLTRNGRASMEHTLSLITAHIDTAYCRDIQPSNVRTGSRGSKDTLYSE